MAIIGGFLVFVLVIAICGAPNWITEITAEQVSAFAALLAAFVAIWTARRQDRRAEATLSTALETAKQQDKRAEAALSAALETAKQQDERSKLTFSVTLIQQYVDRYEGHMKSKRKNAAVYVRQATDETGKVRRERIHNEGRDDLIDVLNFFDSLGTFVRTGAIEAHLLWHAFSPAVQRYWRGAEPIVAYLREDSDEPLTLSDAEYLSKKLEEYRKEELDRAGAQTTVQPSEQEVRKKVRDFLKRETEISV
jgi:hypothetical protein